MDKRDLRSFTLEKLTEEMKSLGEKPFRAKQIYGWLHQKQVTSFDEMTNISKDLRKKLEENYTLKTLKIVEKLVSKEDNTSKYLFDIGDNIVIESVLMKYSYGNAVCISSQAGCRMGCTFCASTIGGLERDRSEHSLFKIGVFTNHKLNWAALVSVVLVALVLFTPLSVPFGLTRLPWNIYGIGVILILVPLVVMEVSKALNIIKPHVNK